MPTPDLVWSSAIAIALSLLIAFIEVRSESKTPFRACLTLESLIYWLVLSFGNVITTLLAAILVMKLPATLGPQAWLLCPFFGVFGFEAVLKNTNVTVFGRGVLTIENWIQTALDVATAAAIYQQENMNQQLQLRLATKLMTMTEEEINTRILHKMGQDVVEKLELSAMASSANTKHYKILQLAAVLSRSEAAVLLRRR